MRRREHIWSLYHTTESNQLDGLRTDQVEVVFAALPPKMREEWHVWKDGFEGWRPLAEFPSILVSLRRMDEREVAAPPEPPPSVGKPMFHGPRPTYEKPEELTAALSLETKVRPEDRGNVRFERKLEVRIYANERVYPNQTVDVSSSGIQLRDPLPQGLPKSFKVEIRIANKIIPLVGSEVKAKPGAPANRMKIEAGEYADALFALLLATA